MPGYNTGGGESQLLLILIHLFNKVPRPGDCEVIYLVFGSSYHLSNHSRQLIVVLYKRTLKYHTTLREGVCSNRQSTVIWEEGGVGQIVI